MTLAVKRGRVRAQLTKMEDELKKVVEEKHREVAEEKGNREVAEELLDKLKRIELKLEELNDAIAPEIVADHQEEEDHGINQYEDFIDRWTTRLKRVIRGSLTPKVENVSENKLDLNRSFNSSPSGVVHLRLPKFDMVKFDGDILKWHGFWSAFSAAVHDRVELCTVDKFNYLRSLLLGEAFRCIEGLAVTEENYATAIDRLKTRFGRTDQIVDSTLTALARLDPPKSDPVSLRRFLDEIEVKLLNLKSLKIDVNSCSGILRPLLVKQLPREVQLAWARRFKEKNGDLDDFIKFFREEIELRESLRLIGEDPKRDQSRSGNVARGFKVNSTAAALNVATKFDRSKIAERGAKERRCCICESLDHTTLDCDISTLNERYRRLKANRRCFNCLWYGHGKYNCRRDLAKCHHCKQNHHSALCPQRFLNENTASVESISGSKIVSTSHVSDDARNTVVLLQTAMVIADGTGGQVKVRCLLDSGSQRSFISRSLTKKIGAEVVGVERMAIGVFGGQNSCEVKEYKKVKVKLFDANGVNCVDVVFREIDSPCSTYSLLPSQWIENEMLRRGFQLADPARNVSSNLEPIEILIGSDYYWSIVTGTVLHLTSKIAAMESIFGWLILGPDQSTETSVKSVSVVSTHVNVSDCVFEGELTLAKEVENFWRLESLGISEVVEKLDVDVLEKFKAEIKEAEGRYMIKLPWNDRKEELLSNYQEASRRFFNVIRKLGRDEENMMMYHDTMIDYVKCGQAEEVREGSDCFNPVYYMPHRSVLRMNHDTMKLRVVFDASSGKPSLNDCLNAGPQLNPDVLDLLLRFRRYPIAITADIEKAFLQVEIDSEDRDAVRFIWLPTDWKYGDPIVPLVYRMKRVVFGLNCGPFLLAATLQYYLGSCSDSYPITTKLLRDNIYVDDMVVSLSTVPDGLRIYNEGKKILSDGGFNLRKWTTNSKELRGVFVENGTSDKDSYSVRTEENVKVLGIQWNQYKDEFYFDISELIEMIEREPATKRTVLKIMARIFDPLGIISPFTIRLKCLFQELWRRKMDWDELLHGEVKAKWCKWVSELPLLNDIFIPRCLSRFESETVVCREIHSFSDANENIYGTCVYLVETNNKGHRRSMLVASKNKVAPMKALSIPRLELMGALLSARLVRTVKKAMAIEEVKTIFWTDSMIVLFWIRGECNRWKQFVANRVSEIKRLTVDSDWRHIGTKLNPADKITRGLSVENLKSDEIWWFGPSVLQETLDEEINCEIDEGVRKEVMSESRKGNVEVCAVSFERPPWEASRFGSWGKLLRTVAWVLRFVFIRSENRGKGKFLNVNELRCSERVILQLEQKIMYPEEYAALKDGFPVSSTSSILRLDPIMKDDNLIRLGGRLQFATLCYTAKHPVILRGNSEVSSLIIMDCHKRVLHGGVSETMAEVRERYWIVHARSSVSKVLRKCVLCERYRVKACKVVEAPLPVERVEIVEPFQIVGLDYAGPLFVKENGSIQNKVYILLITCAVSRAIHLELVRSMKIDDFLLAFRRFISRRGYCSMIFSDNAKTFKRASKDLKCWEELVQNGKVQRYLTDFKIVWKFIADRAPWWGGIWERMVRSVKEKLKIVCGRALFSFDELGTILVEVEATLNSRPLTYLPDDKQEVITPAHLVTGRRFTCAPLPITSVERFGSDVVGKMWKRRIEVLNQFWRAWKKDYLLQLRTAHERKNVGLDDSVRKDQVVLLEDEKMGRQMWKICVIKDVIKGRDGLIRSCMLKLPGEGKVVKRPIQLIYPLEVVDGKGVSPLSGGECNEG